LVNFYVVAVGQVGHGYPDAEAVSQRWQARRSAGQYRGQDAGQQRCRAWPEARGLGADWTEAARAADQLAHRSAGRGQIQEGMLLPPLRVCCPPWQSVTGDQHDPLLKSASNALSLLLGILLVMAISDRTRKTLWIRAGGRCSLCRVLLATDGTLHDAPSVFGQEAHIVAQAPGGPRAGDVAEVDSYGNLILLCSVDHKRIDDQVQLYTPEILKAIKAAHETWVQTQGQVYVAGVPLGAPAAVAPPPALSVALNIQMSDEALFFCALLLTLGLVVLAYQVRAA